MRWDWSVIFSASASSNGGSMNIFTTILAGILAAAPMFMPFIPAPYNALASGVIALAGSVYHLYQPAPGAPTGALVPKQ